jgi:hypothetical protein
MFSDAIATNTEGHTRSGSGISLWANCLASIDGEDKSLAVVPNASVNGLPFSGAPALVPESRATVLDGR